MVRIFKTEDGVVRQIEAVENGCWVALTDPTATEILEVAEQFGIDPDDVKAPLDLSLIHILRKGRQAHK